AQAFVPPDWFGENVSGDYRYTNASLALSGFL
ncbi:MAG: adenylate cyclase, partial [Eubacterium sp.]|nr:adenylate cyclase [Eubacterium sp.]